MTMLINDLEMTQELDRKAMAATRGGHGKRYAYAYGNRFGDVSRSVVVNDRSSLDNTGGVIATGDGNAILSLGANNDLEKVHFNIHF